jgi:hypothetical protein
MEFDENCNNNFPSWNIGCLLGEVKGWYPVHNYKGYCTNRVLSSIVTHSYMFRPYWVETCRSVLRLMIKLFMRLLVISVFCMIWCTYMEHIKFIRDTLTVCRMTYCTLALYRIYEIKIAIIWIYYSLIAFLLIIIITLIPKVMFIWDVFI